MLPKHDLGGRWLTGSINTPVIISFSFCSTLIIPVSLGGNYSATHGLIPCRVHDLVVLSFTRPYVETHWGAVLQSTSRQLPPSMKTASLYIALGAAHLVLCAPTTGVSTDPQSNDPDAVAAPRTWTTYLDENEAAGRDRHDPISRPDPSPFASDDGDAPAPLSGKWELDSGSPAQLGEQPPPTELSRVPHSALDEDDEVWELLEGLEGATPPRAGMPCHHGPSSRERNDMLVVFLAAAFMVAVVVMETWGRLFRRHGAIRLEETTNQAPVSIRAMSEEQIGIGDEKRRV